MGVLKQWLPYVLSGISAGGQYALIAVGYTMVYGILRLINFAHGDIFMVAGLIMVYLSATMPLYAALPAVSYTPDKITKRGIARTFQNIRLFKSMTVFENVLTAMHLRRTSNVFSATFRANRSQLTIYH